MEVRSMAIITSPAEMLLAEVGSYSGGAATPAEAGDPGSQRLDLKKVPRSSLTRMQSHSGHVSALDKSCWNRRENGGLSKSQRDE